MYYLHPKAGSALLNVYGDAELRGTPARRYAGIFSRRPLRDYALRADYTSICDQLVGSPECFPALVYAARRKMRCG